MGRFDLASALTIDCHASLSTVHPVCLMNVEQREQCQAATSSQTKPTDWL